MKPYFALPVACLTVWSLSITGCAGLGLNGGTSGSAPVAAVSDRFVPGNEASELLAFMERIRGMSAAELAREMETVKTTSGSGATPLARMRLAVLLATPGIAGRDEVRAIAIADGLRTEVSTPTDLKRLAGVLRHFWADQKRVLEGAGTHQAEVRRLNEQVTAQTAEQKRLQEALQASQQKLEALKAIEKNLSEREVRPRSGAK